MSALTKQMNVIQDYGTKIGGAVRESQKIIEVNQFPLSANNGKLAKYAFWASASAGVLVGLAAVQAAPVIGAIAVGVSVGIGVIGSALDRIAQEREQIRREHAQFVSQARSFMKELQVAYNNTKHALQEEQRLGSPMSADFVQYQAQRQEQAQQMASAPQSPKTEHEPASTKSTGLSLG